MSKPLNYLAMVALSLGVAVSPVLAQGKSSRERGGETNGDKADRDRGGEAAPDRSSRSQARRGSKADRDGPASEADRAPGSTNKRRR